MLLTNKFSRKSPWNTVLMYLAACLILGWFLPSSGSILVTLPILDAMIEQAGSSKEKRPMVGVMLALGAVVAGQLGNGSTPISHAVTIQGMGMYNTLTGAGEPDFFALMGILMPISIICLIACWLIFRHVWHPDVTILRNVDFDVLRATVAPMDTREKWSATLYGLVIVAWVLPGLAKYIMPAAYPTLSQIANLYPPIVALVIMQLITVEDGKPILSWKEALANVNWNTFVFIACIMCVGSAFSKDETGLTEWLTAVMSPIFANVSPMLFLLIIVAAGVILTNFISNAVAVSIMLTIALPLAMGVYADSLNTMLVGLLAINAVQHAWSTPPATPSAAVASGYGWLDTGNMFKWGMVIAVVNIFLILGVGSLMGAMIF
jgi:sodium-dependent dicarboxylate transporter 2/3/5